MAMMKNALILHGTDGNSSSNWIPWLKNELEIIGFDVWAPDLPNASAPNLQAYTRFIAAKNFAFNKDTILVGHSSGAVALMGLLPKIGTQVKATFLVSAFENDLGWQALGGLFEKPLDFQLIRENGGKIFFIHSDDDPYVPIEHANSLANKTAGTLILIPGQGHFNTEKGAEYKKFDKLLGKIKEIAY